MTNIEAIRHAWVKACEEAPGLWFLDENDGTMCFAEPGEAEGTEISSTAVDYFTVTAGNHFGELVENIRLIRQRLHADDPERATVLIDELAHQLGLP